eukprot:5042796-Prymnesium_polylepis.3
MQERFELLLGTLQLPRECDKLVELPQRRPVCLARWPPRRLLEGDGAWMAVVVGEGTTHHVTFGDMESFGNRRTNQLKLAQRESAD